VTVTQGQNQLETGEKDLPVTIVGAEAGSRPRRLTRRRLLKGAGVAGLAAIGGGAFGVYRLVSGGGTSTGRARVFVSRPDLRPPAVAVTGAISAAGYLFLGPKSSGGSQPGALLIDGYGEPVWFKPLPSGMWTTNVRVSRYRDRPVLTLWEGKVVSSTYGRGEGVILDSAYREVARVRPGNGRHMDLHEFVLTPQGTALFTCYPETVRADLSSIGGPRDGQARESIIQEVDVHSGRVLFEWRSLEHIPVTESYQSLAEPYDYLHANSIDVAPDGNLLVSARHTWALYKLDRRTGQVIWRLGGKRSDFQMGPGSRFAWQHDARAISDRQITVFDDGAGPHQTESQSRGIVLEVDAAAKRVRLARSYRHPRPLLADSLGSVQALPDGRMLVSWGNQPYASEFAADGHLATDVELGSGHDSYRVSRYRWTASPADAPALVTGRHQRAGTVYVSWNGATEVSRWEVSAGPSPQALRRVGVAPRRGFETTIQLAADEGYARVTALDARGRRLAASAAVRL
jgi:Arylsulfotransferase (ASST)